MFPSLVEVYNNNDLIGTDATTAENNFDQNHPIYQALASYAGLYREHDALRRGAQIHRYSTDTPGVYAFSRIGRDEQVEYVVAFNNSTDMATASVPTFYASGTNFDLLHGADGQDASLVTGDDGALELSVPALSFAIYRAQTPLSASEAAPGISISSLEDGQEVSLAYQPQDGHLVLERIEVRAELERDVFAEVNFAVSVDGGAFEYIGTDNNAPYRVLYDPGQHLGSELSFMAIANDLNGNLSSAMVSGITVNVDEPTGPETDYPFAVIHYRRPAGDYGTTTAATEDDWGVHTWGEAITPGQGENVWSDPIPFRGETEFGRFAYFALSDGSSPLNFIVHTPSGDNIPLTREPGGDRSFVPNETPQVWLVQGDETVYTSQAAAQGFVTVHYLSDDEAEVGFDVMAGEMMMGEGLEPTTTSDTGATLTIDLPEDLDLGTPLTVTVRAQGEALSETSFIPSQQATAWLTPGSDVAHASRAAARNVALIHYYRPDGDYGDYDSDDYNDFWGVHVWTGAANPTDWPAPIKPSGQDAFGVYFEIPLAEDATELAYIIHRGDAKDPGPDQFLGLEAVGYEVWQPSGANPEAAYAVPPVELPDAN
ncbi:MAG: pullulanase-associated domain-containing protein [Trueperaceae bacterium]|nr:pullulanase-associated domain-containing protein [Trueperaceae bacterium]